MSTNNRRVSSVYNPPAIPDYLKTKTSATLQHDDIKYRTDCTYIYIVLCVWMLTIHSLSLSSPSHLISTASMTSMAGNVYIKWGFPWLFRGRYATLSNCTLTVFKTHSQTPLFTYTFHGGKVLNSRTPNTLKLVNVQSQTLYMCCESGESFAMWAKAITHNLKMHTAGVWEEQALNMHALATIAKGQ